jgi:hypothetical protein
MDTKMKVLLTHTLRWYWSPYLTTLLTAPMFLVLVSLGIHYAWNLIVQILLMGNFLFGMLASCMMTLGLYLVWGALTGIPQLWDKVEWSATKRVLVIAGVFLGSVVAGGVLDILNLLLWNLVRGPQV